MTNAEAARALAKHDRVLYKFWDDFKIKGNCVGSWSFQPYWARSGFTGLDEIPDLRVDWSDEHATVRMPDSGTGGATFFWKYGRPSESVKVSLEELEELARQSEEELYSGFWGEYSQKLKDLIEEARKKLEKIEQKYIKARETHEKNVGKKN